VSLGGIVLQRGPEAQNGRESSFQDKVKYRLILHDKRIQCVITTIDIVLRAPPLRPSVMLLFLVLMVALTSTSGLQLYTCFIYTNIYTHRTVMEFITQGSICTFLVRYMKDHFPSHTAVICRVCTDYHPIPASTGTSLTAGAAPHHRVAPRFDTSITM